MRGALRGVRPERDTVLGKRQEGKKMMRNVNVADEAKAMTDGELAATIRALSDEQMRRAAIPADKPDPEITAMLQERHAEFYGVAE